MWIEPWQWSSPSAFIAHHGRPGQRWHVRNGPPYPLDREAVRSNYDGKEAKIYPSNSKSGVSDKNSVGVNKYVNKNGTLTSLGKAKILDLYKASEKSDGIDEKLGLKRLSNGVEVMVKGSEVKRYAGEEGIDARRKYVSFRPDDVKQYRKDLDTLYIEGQPYLYVYRLKKDIKVAPTKVVCEELMKSVGQMTVEEALTGDATFGKKFERSKERLKRLGILDTKVKDLYSGDFDTYVDQKRYIKSISNKSYADYYKRMTRKDPELSDAYAMFEYGKYAVSAALDKKLLDTGVSKNYIGNTLKAKGYDACVDVYDVLYGYSKPLIIFDPRDSLELVNKNRILFG